ncbi:MAG: response regulator transcription factor [Alkaliphilus sp.]
MHILIVDDDALIRDSLKIMFDLDEDFIEITTASNGQEALEACNKKEFDVVLMDIRMPIMDGVLATKKIKEQFKDIKIIILTTFKEDEYIKQAIKNGAEGYILKNQPVDSIIESIKIVNKGNTVFQKEIVESITMMLKKDDQMDKQRYDFSAREFEVLKLVGNGLSNKEISKKLFLGEGTVRNYVSILLGKIMLRDRTQLAIFYLKNYEE